MFIVKVMVKKIFYQGSMPRSGSTLFQNIMAQNPDFYATPTSGLCEALINLKINVWNAIEFKAQDQVLMEAGFKGMCNGLLTGFFDNVTDKKYVIDKSRGWGVTYDFLDWFYPNPKVVILIRDLRSIVSSLEKKFRDNQHLDSGLQRWGELKGTTIDKRIDMYLNLSPPLNVSMDAIYDVIIRRISQKCLFIKFEDLTRDPKVEMCKVYNYFELPYYENHNFDDVQQVTYENDVFYKPFGDHMIRGKIQPIEDDYLKVLGKHNCDYITNKYDWYFKAFNYTV